MQLELSSWTEFKNLCVTALQLPCRYIETADRYDLYGPDVENIMWHLPILKSDPASADQADFESLIATKFNQKNVVQLDSDGAPMSRTKVAPTGWSYQLRGVELVTSTLGSIVNKDAYNSDLSDATLKLYDASGNLITDQTTADSSCVKTILDVEPPYDIYAVGGKLRFMAAPVSDIRLSVIGVPDVPDVAGGSKQFVNNVNLRYIPVSEGVNADGRAAKWLQYSATYHTNKFRFTFFHDAGFKQPMSAFLELYKQ